MPTRSPENHPPPQILHVFLCRWMPPSPPPPTSTPHIPRYPISPSLSKRLWDIVVRPSACMVDPKQDLESQKILHHRKSLVSSSAAVNPNPPFSSKRWWDIAMGPSACLVDPNQDPDRNQIELYQPDRVVSEGGGGAVFGQQEFQCSWHNFEEEGKVEIEEGDVVWAQMGNDDMVWPAMEVDPKLWCGLEFALGAKLVMLFGYERKVGDRHSSSAEVGPSCLVGLTSPGPEDPSVLALHSLHRSQVVWDGSAKNYNFWKHAILSMDPRIAPYLIRVSFYEARFMGV